MDCCGQLCEAAAVPRGVAHGRRMPCSGIATCLPMKKHPVGVRYLFPLSSSIFTNKTGMITIKASSWGLQGDRTEHLQGAVPAASSQKTAVSEPPAVLQMLGSLLWACTHHTQRKQRCLLFTLSSLARISELRALFEIFFTKG